VDQAVADGIGQRRLSDGFVPSLHGQLGGDEGGGALGPVLDDLEQVATVLILERCQPG